MTELLLIRHGETEWNKEGKFQGCTDVKLSEDGIKQAAYLKASLKNDFDIIYTSPLSRAYDTARILCEDKKELEPILLPEIREINFGSWEGLTIKDIKDRYPNEFHLWNTDELNGALMGGDLSIRNASTRAKNAILEVVKQHIGKKIIIVAHGGILKAGLIGIFDWKMTMYQRMFLGNTSVTKLQFDNSLKPILLLLNNTSHLPDSTY